MSRSTLLVCVLVLILAVPVALGALGAARSVQGGEPLQAVSSTPEPKVRIATAKAAADTSYVYGEPGTLEGKFEDAAGQPDWQGWTGYDRSQNPWPNRWHPSTTHAAGLGTASQQYDFSEPAALNDPVASFGGAVAVAGDVNGDGIDDIVVGSTGGNGGGAALYFGGSGSGAAPDLFFDPDQPYIYADDLGAAVAGAGDVNGDGFDDFVIAAPLTYNYRLGIGRVFLYLGGPLLDDEPDLIYEEAHTDFGRSVAGVGDVNGDGFDDVAIGCDDAMFLYLGAATPDRDHDGTQAPVIGSTPSRVVVGAAGDLNGDGYADFVMGLPEAAGGYGGIVVALGGATMPPDYDFSLAGGTQDHAWGHDVAGVGDFNADGFDDIVVGSYAPIGLGKAKLILGVEDFVSEATVAMTYGTLSWHRSFGRAVCALGDINGDGYADFAAGEAGSPDNGGNGIVRVFHGKATPFTGPDFDDAVVYPASSVALVGEALDGPLDFDGDGEGDYLIGAPASPTAGHAYVLTPASLNHGLFCGVEAGEPGFAATPGYGNNWRERLEFYWDVPDPAVSTPVSLAADLAVSIEDAYDYLYVRCATATGEVTLDAITGASGPTQSIWNHQYGPNSYVTNPATGNPAILLRFLLVSDPIYSDEDGQFVSGTGAVVMDGIIVWVDGVQVSSATFEPVGPGGNPDTRPGAMPDHDSGGWLRPAGAYCGDFSGLVSGFVDADPLVDNLTPQVAFFDDGTPPANDPQQRSTGGTYNVYGYGVADPGGGGYWGTNNTGGIGRLEYLPTRLWNEVQSPPFVWNDPATSDDDLYLDALMKWDAWLDLPLRGGWSMWSYWMLRHWSPTEGWSAWENDNLVRYSDTAVYRNELIHIDRFIPADAESLQVALGVRETMVFGPEADAVSTAAPLFDNVKVVKTRDRLEQNNTTIGIDVLTIVGDLSITYNTVGIEGTTSLVTSFESPGYAEGFGLATDPPLYFDVQTTADVYPPFELCFSYDETALAVSEADLVLLHWDELLPEPAWVDITTSLDTVGNTVCGTTQHLSPFAIGAVYPGSPVPGDPGRNAFMAPPAPNPLNPRTEIAFTLDVPGVVDLAVYDLRGRLVTRLADGQRMTDGRHVLPWDGRDRAGRDVASGAYFVRLRIDGETVLPVRKVAIVR